jgi:hypothetical protein
MEHSRYNNFPINGLDIKLNDVLEVIGMSLLGKESILENGDEFVVSAFNGSMNKAWLTSTKTTKTITITSEVDSTYFVFSVKGTRNTK